MLKVMFVDDEPFIMQGLSVLIDWNARGYEIVKMASNGGEAYEYLKNNKVDLVIADISMPVMTGLDLLKKNHEEHFSDAYFVILSGYNDFEYARTALRYSCMDYLLKPIDRQQLIDILDRVSESSEVAKQGALDEHDYRKHTLVNNLMKLLCGRFDCETLDSVHDTLPYTVNPIRFIAVSVDNIPELEDMDDEEIALIRDRIYDNTVAYLGSDMYVFKSALDYLDNYEIGYIFSDKICRDSNMNQHEFLEKLAAAASEGVNAGAVLLVGKEVESLDRLSISYANACILRSSRSFSDSKRVYYYEDEVQASENQVVLCKQSLDELIRAIEQNDITSINRSVDTLYSEMGAEGLNGNIISMNINYLLFQLIHLAVEQDESVNQGEVLQYLSAREFEVGTARGSSSHLKRFACSYAEYLIQLRKNVSRGVLQEVEKEINQNYSENLTLRELSKKYYVNSSYLGQIFKKKYNQSFKDYLCNVRINEAAKLLLNSDEKITQIADMVGYKDTDYFIQKFIELKGVTPAKYRRNGGNQ